MRRQPDVQPKGSSRRSRRASRPFNFTTKSTTVSSSNLSSSQKEAWILVIKHTQKEMEEKSQPHLMAQDAATVDPSKLTALTPEVVSAL
jgi:hypothetical protein